MDEIYIVNIERAILSSIFFDPYLIEEIQVIIKEKDFYLQAHQKIFKIILDLYKENLPIDEEFVRIRLNKQQEYMKTLVDILSANAITNCLAYVIEIKEASKKRQINNLATKIKTLFIDVNNTSDDLLNIINKEIELLEQNTTDKILTSKEIVHEVKLDMNKALENSNRLGQISGLKALDEIIGSFEDGDLIIIAARPSMGKTSLISSIVNQTLEDGNAVLIESLEMPAKKIMVRLIASRSSESLSDLKKGYIKNIEKFNEATNFFACENLILHDKTYPTLIELQSRIKKAIRDNPKIKNIFIDHTGKIQLEGKTREDIEIGYITGMLKKIARDFNIRVFLLQQLNRSVENRDNKRPMLSDLKNSGNIEEDADVVLGLYRDSYYKSKEKATYENNIENAEIIVLKNRDGETRTAKVAFEGRCARFIDRIENKIPVIIEYGE